MFLPNVQAEVPIESFGASGNVSGILHSFTATNTTKDPADLKKGTADSKRTSNLKGFC